MDEPDFDDYFDDIVDNSDEDHNWLLNAAMLLGAVYVLESLKPQFKGNNMVISPPKRANSISDTVFSSVLNLDVSWHHYLYNEREIAGFKGIMDGLRHHGRLEDPRTVENTMTRWMVQRNDRLGLFGDIESFKAGGLDLLSQTSFDGYRIMLPWNPTGPNTCDECGGLVGELYDPDDFPEPPHFGCQCNDPMADPVLIPI